MKEPQLVLKIRKAAEAKYGDGIYIKKIHGGRYSAGIPDLLGCLRIEPRHDDDFGVFFAIEVKLEGKERNVTPLQQANLDAIMTACGYQTVVTSVQDALEFLDRILGEFE